MDEKADEESTGSSQARGVAVSGICWVQRLVRRLSRFAWQEMLWDVGRVEWKYGRTDDGKPKNWDEWNNVRAHLREAGKLRQPQELDLPNTPGNTQ
jgi:hypothetical protein